MSWYGRAVFVFSAFCVVIGVALLVRTAAEGGGTAGYLLGALFVAVGAGRITLERKRGG